MTRVLHIVGGMGLGGTETFLMNIYRNINFKKLQFDFVIYDKNKCNDHFENEIINLGGRIHYLDYSYNIFGLIRLLKKEKYSAIHTHTKFNGGIALIAAFICNVKIRIAHSHNTGGSNSYSVLKKTYNFFMYIAINLFANKFASCSKKAGEHLFTVKNIDNKHTFIPNAIDVSRFFDIQSKNVTRLKSSLNIPKGGKIIGHVGRYGKAKNHEFIVQMFSDLLKQDSDFYLILIGDGPTRRKIEQQIYTLGITDNVMILGLRNDVPKLMNIFDIFILPSLYEGFGIVLLEAQACGLPCIVSENIQPEVDLKMGLINWINLSQKSKWIAAIKANQNNKIKNKDIIKEKIARSPFVLEKVVNDFYTLYDLVAK